MVECNIRDKFEGSEIGVGLLFRMEVDLSDEAKGLEWVMFGQGGRHSICCRCWHHRGCRSAAVRCRRRCTVRFRVNNPVLADIAMLVAREDSRGGT